MHTQVKTGCFLTPDGEYMLRSSGYSPPNSPPPKALTVFLHGIGSNRKDLIGISLFMTDYLPGMHFVAPDAPFQFENEFDSYQWCGLKDTSTTALLAGLNEAMPFLNKFIDAQLKKFNLKEEHLVVIGFSQGAMIALHTFLRRPRPVALIIGLSGMMVDDGSLERECKSKPNVLLMHGDNDSVVPLKDMEATYSKLKDLGIQVEKKVYNNLEHVINRDEILNAIEHIKTRLHLL